MDQKCCVQLAIIGYLITLDKVHEANDICYGFLAVPNKILVARYLALLGDLQTTAIARHQESILSLDYLGCERLVATLIEGHLLTLLERTNRLL